MTVEDHQYRGIGRNHVSCTCGWIDDGDYTTAESITVLMSHAYEIGALEATADTLDRLTDEPGDWAKLATELAEPTPMLPIIVVGDPDDRSTWKLPDGTPVSFDFNPGNRGVLVIPLGLVPDDGLTVDWWESLFKAMSPKPRDTRPHSRACGWRDHEHGPACHRNCPTCGGLDWKAER